MPGHSNLHLQQPLENLYEHWLGNRCGPRRQIEEFVNRLEAIDVMNGLMITGFARGLGQERRTPPIPVVVQVLYRSAPPESTSDLATAVVEAFGQVQSEWCRLRSFIQPLL